MLDVGVIGVGSMGQNHARLYSDLADLVGVYDADLGRAKEVAERFNTTAYEDMNDLMRQADAVSVCVPNAMHFRVAREVISRGVSALVEKPFTGESERAAELCRMAEEAGVTLASGFVERFNPVVHAARDSMRRRSFGDVISLATRRVSSYPARIKDVGVIMDLAIHDIDVTRFITGYEVEAVYALGGRYNHERFEDYVDLFLEMGNGVVAFVEANWLTPMKVRRMSFTCSDGFVEMDYIDQRLEACSSQFREMDPFDMFRVPLETDVRRISVRKEEPLRRELKDFLSAVEEDREPLCGGREAERNLKVCEAAQRSLSRKERVEVGQSE